MVWAIPLPETPLQITWTIIGFVFSRAFGKQLDRDIQNGEWFKGLSKPWQNFVKRLLDATHHFWMGMLLMVYAGKLSGWFSLDPQIFFWVGWGFFVDDWPDMPARFVKYFRYLEPAIRTLIRLE